ncbi:hypothetical protein ACWDGI_39070 [Streptomyces sp. NPDC001220]
MAEQAALSILIIPTDLEPPCPGADVADMILPDPVTRDILAIFEDVRSRLFERLENLTDTEYHWEPVSDCISIRPGDDGVFRVGNRVRMHQTPSRRSPGASGTSATSACAAM